MHKNLRDRLTYANVVSSLALFLVLTGGLAFAALKRNSVTTKQIKDGQVKTADVGDEEIGFADLDSNSVGSPKIINGSVLGPDLGADSVDAAAIEAGAIGTPEFGDVPAVKVTASGAIPFADSNSAAIPFDSEAAPGFDPYGMHDPAQPARLEAPVDGIYDIDAMLRWVNDPDDDDVFRLSMRETSGPTTIAFVSQEGDDGFSQDPTTLRIGTLANLEAGQTVEIVALQDNFDNDANSIQATSGMPYFAMHWVSPG